MATSKFNKIEKMAQDLSVQERARLARHLIITLDEEESDMDEKELESLWVKEAERRSQDIRNGVVVLRPAEDVMREARLKLE
jgi:Putative addiction module component